MANILIRSRLVNSEFKSSHNNLNRSTSTVNINGKISFPVHINIKYNFITTKDMVH